MLENYSEQSIKDNCPHCDRTCWAFDYILKESSYFTILCDANPLIEAHLLIIPKRHVSCIAEYTPEEFVEFKKLYSLISEWICKEYGSIATFEHGKIGQTVFHSHVHLMPFLGQAEEIVPEGMKKLNSLQSLDNLFNVFQEEGQYLFFSLGSKMWTVDTSIGRPRFFRDRFAKALRRVERGNWKEMRKNPQLLATRDIENKRCQDKFNLSLKDGI
ncbi:MAG: HIT family protein [Chlamydiales bacterium]|nr:HIT family protein [Chlamydiales bacterium]